MTKIKNIIDSVKNEKGNLVLILQEIQKAFGYISLEMIEFIAQYTNYCAAHIQGVATFYTQFRSSPQGKKTISVCDGTACHVNGSKKIVDAISKHLKIKNGETTSDGLYTLQTVACIGCCSLAPAIMIDGEVFGKFTVDALFQITNNKQ